MPFLPRRSGPPNKTQCASLQADRDGRQKQDGGIVPGDIAVGVTLAEIPNVEDGALRRAPEVFQEPAGRIKPEPGPKQKENGQPGGAPNDQRLEG